jgi:hypothetical protein
MATILVINSFDHTGGQDFANNMSKWSIKRDILRNLESIYVDIYQSLMGNMDTGEEGNFRQIIFGT